MTKPKPPAIDTHGMTVPEAKKALASKSKLTKPQLKKIHKHESDHPERSRKGILDALEERIGQKTVTKPSKGLARKAPDVVEVEEEAVEAEEYEYHTYSEGLGDMVFTEEVDAESIPTGSPDERAALEEMFGHIDDEDVRNRVIDGLITAAPNVTAKLINELAGTLGTLMAAGLDVAVSIDWPTAPTKDDLDEPEPIEGKTVFVTDQDGIVHEAVIHRVVGLDAAPMVVRLRDGKDTEHFVLYSEDRHAPMTWRFE